MMNASEIAGVLETIAPNSLAYKGEEMGFIVGTPDKKVRVVAITERPTLEVLIKAVKESVDMLIIHEPLYFSKKTFLADPSRFKFQPNTKRNELVDKGNFCVFRFHSQWDDAKGGNNEILAELLGIKVDDRLPYGRIGTIGKTSLKILAGKVKKILNTQKVMLVGDLEKEIERVAVVAGSGNSLLENMELATDKGAQALISGDIRDSAARYATELGLALIDAGDYFTENPGAVKLTEMLKSKLKGLKVIHLDPGPPWKYY